MAEWPANGVTDWNTKMREWVNVEHNEDGTHNQEDWTPSAYAGEESITFPNGLIFKHGRVTSVVGGVASEVTYGVAFPTAIVSMSATFDSAAANINESISIEQKAGSLLSILRLINSTSGTHDVWWQAWGY